MKGITRFNAGRVAYALLILLVLTSLGIVIAQSLAGESFPKRVVRHGLEEVGKRGFGNPAVAYENNSEDTVRIYGDYKGCRLTFNVFKGSISYPEVGDDVNPAMLDADPRFQPCRQAASNTQPTR